VCRKNISLPSATHSSHIVHLPSVNGMTGGGTSHSTRSDASDLVSGSGAVELDHVTGEGAAISGGRSLTGFILTSGIL